MSTAPATCKLGTLLPDLPEPDQALVRGWLVDGKDVHGWTVSAEALAAALAAEGHAVGPTTLKAHRRGACLCFRP